MKTVLFITYFFPPLAGAGVGRTLKFSRNLPELGWKPIIISASENVQYTKDYSLLKEVSKELDVHRIGHKKLPSSEIQYLRNKLKIAYDFPDIFKNWYLPAYQEARKILNKEKIDLIFSSSAPFTSHFIAMKLHDEFNIPWVADFRDPWSGNDILNSHYEKMLVKPLRYRIKSKIKYEERRIIENADRTIVTSWYHQQQLRELHHVSSDKLEVITNGYDELDFNDLKYRNKLYPEKITITFIGSFYTGFKELALDFLRTLYEIDHNIEMIYIGKSASEMSNISMENLTCINNIPRQKMLTLSSGSDFLFIVMPSSAKWIPGKLFEYLRLGKPIIALTPEDGDAAKIIRNANAGFILSFDKLQMKWQLKTILENYKNGIIDTFMPNNEYISQYERGVLARKLADIFNKVSI